MTPSSSRPRLFSGPIATLALLVLGPALAAVALPLNPFHRSAPAPQHMAKGERATVTTLWRSERGLDKYAKEGATIADAVAKAASEEGGSPFGLGITETPKDLATLMRFEDAKSVGDEAGESKAETPAEDVEDAGDEGDFALPYVMPYSSAIEPAGAVVSVMPRIHDRVMFGVGLPPATRWALALESARAAGATGDLLAPAMAGLAAESFSKGLEEEPYTSTTLLRLQAQLSVMAPEKRTAWLQKLGESPLPTTRFLSLTEPDVAPEPLLARHLLATEQSADDVLAKEPKWLLESGAVGSHPFGWQVVGTRKSDALILNPEPLPGDPFTLRCQVVVFSNSLKTPGQADVVIGDRGGDRYLLALNTIEGIYLFRRPGPDAPYEAVAEVKEVPIPAGRPVDVVLIWADDQLAINVGGVDLPVQLLGPGALAGRYGIGAHAGSTALISEPTIE